MSIQLDNLLNEALQLSHHEGSQLADSLINSLEKLDSDADAAWAAEVQKRSQEYKDEKAVTISWSELRDSVRQQVED